MSYRRDDYDDDGYRDDRYGRDDDYDRRRGYRDDDYEDRRRGFREEEYRSRDVFGGRGGDPYRREQTRGFDDYQQSGGYRQAGYGGQGGYQQQGYGGGPTGGGGRNPMPPPAQRKKSLLIGINYVGSQHQLQGCHQDVNNVWEFRESLVSDPHVLSADSIHTVRSQGYPTDSRSQVIMRDDNRTDPSGPFFPNGHNILAAMQWLVSEPGTTNFLHYSGHGGQVPADDDYRASNFDDTIVPVDFERNGQIPSGVLHRTLISRLPPNSTLFIVFDCCHSGSAVELPYVYRADANGNVNMMDNLQTGMHLVGEASHLIQGGFTIDKVSEARTLLAGATDFFRGLMHEPAQTDQYGLGQSDTYNEYEQEGAKNVWMYSGCRDDQTSADASIAGSHVGAMSWAFLEVMRQYGAQQSWVQVLTRTRELLKGRYQQIPQLSVGFQQDLNWGIRV